MSTSPDKYAKKRARSSAISTVIGIALVLFMLGILSVLVLNAQKLSNYVKENIQVQVFLNDDVNEADILRLKKEIDAEVYTHSTKYVSKEDAAKELSEDLGEDFISFLGYNPLQAAIDLRLNADYAHPDSVEAIVEGIEDRSAVAEVVYSPNLIRQINENVNKIGLILLGFAALLLLANVEFARSQNPARNDGEACSPAPSDINYLGPGQTVAQVERASIQNLGAVSQPFTDKQKSESSSSPLFQSKGNFFRFS